MRTTDRAAAVTLVAACCLLTAGVAGAGAAESGFDTPFQTGDVDPDTVVLRADVAENGTAAWSVEYRVRLDDENTTAAFESFAADVRANRSAYADRFAGRMARTASVAENATGRSMAITNVSVTAERRQLPQEYGVVTYEFTWTNFAAVDGDRLQIGDALSGFFLDAESQLILSWPDGYTARSVTPDADERSESSVVWRGPVDFGPEEPRIVVSAGGGAPVVAVGAVLAALLLGGGFVYYRRREDDAVGGGGGSPLADDGGEAAATEPTEADDRADADDASDDEGTPPEELLSPEERVLAFVEERGGRVKQQDVVAEFDWTAARTSQVVGKLRDAGDVETFRLGRENVITLPDEEETEAFADPTPDPKHDDE